MHSIPVISKVGGDASHHWRRQLWGIGACAFLDFQQFIFYASLCSYKSMKAIFRVKCVQDFAYHGY